MRAKKCDRCGKFFDFTDRESKYRVISQMQSSKRYTRAMDLCPECVSQLEKFIEGNFASEKSNTTEEDGGI